jgi:hypothetical protein
MLEKLGWIMPGPTAPIGASGRHPMFERSSTAVH